MKFYYVVLSYLSIFTIGAFSSSQIRYGEYHEPITYFFLIGIFITSLKLSKGDE